MRDVHASAPEGRGQLLRRVGVSTIRKPLSIQRKDRVVTLTATFRVAVDLPASRKGSDLSRNAELLAEVIDATALRPAASLESVCVGIATDLLSRHSYATEAEVDATAEYFLSRGISEGRQSLEDYLLVAQARAVRNGAEPPQIFRAIGAEAVGMTACPCAMETARTLLTEEFPLLNDPALAKLPIVSHNQRNRTRLTFELPPGADIEADAIIDAIESAQSSPTYAILKRRDEATVVINAHRNPKFVEDVVRDLLNEVLRRFPELPDAARVRVETTSEESIHKYDVSASHAATLGELRSTAA
ncbi:MAG: GTP cyclohydrolase MptA [Thermoplasmata archaeon]|nr:GTP cyclohydrolase MptA [Thermoplasmata archaeon]